MVLYPNKLPESERVCFGICMYQYMIIFLSSGRRFRIVASLFLFFLYQGAIFLFPFRKRIIIYSNYLVFIPLGEFFLLLIRTNGTSCYCKIIILESNRFVV